ncbi:MAG: response regulator, partial [candidate division Zixibacteria bacterium]|nr:response regulator [candidate division Zixibacteria bacterium]
DIVRTTPESKKAMEDFILASRVKLLMVEKKQDVDVSAENGRTIITLKKHVMRLEHHKDELRKLAKEVPGVGEVEFKIGPKFRMPTTYPPVDLETPKKTLLVDDEVEFVQTLSERLQSRQIKSSVAYNGEEALSVVEEDAPEVMVLDLKMPGIDGIEVLRRTKRDHPDTEIIILTGHGSEKERQRALELGAFAYLEKPVDIDVLAETMKKAYAKVNLSKKSDDSAD